MKKIIYYDIAFNKNCGHWSNIADHLQEIFLEHNYDFLHVTDPNTCVNKILRDVLQTYSSVIFYSYFSPSITTIGKIYELAKNYSNVQFLMNYLPTDEQNLIRDMVIMKNYFIKSHRKNFHLLADNDNLYEYLSKNFSIVNTELVSPLILPTSKEIIKKPVNSKTKFNILFIYNKQTDTRFIESVIDRVMASSNNHLTIKVRPNLNLNLEYLKNKINQNRITIVNSFTTKNRYYEILRESNLIIINYNEPYFFRSSGMLLEAIFFKKILLIPSGGWLDKTLKKYGSGKAFLKNDFDDFIQKYDQIVQNFDGYEKISQFKYDEFMNRFDPQKIVAHIINCTKTLKIDTKPNHDLIIFYVASIKTSYDRLIIQKIYKQLKKTSVDSKFVICTFDKTRTLKQKLDNELYFLDAINLNKYQNILIYPYNMSSYEYNFLSDIETLMIEKYNKKLYIVDRCTPCFDSCLKIKPIIRSAHILIICDEIDCDQLNLIQEVDKSKQLDICYVGEGPIKNKRFLTNFVQVSPNINFTNYNIAIILIDSPEILAEAMVDSIVILTDYNFKISEAVRNFQIGRAFNQDNIFFAFRNILKKYKSYKDNYSRKAKGIDQYINPWKFTSFLDTVVTIPISDKNGDSGSI
jgi:glycosyltransferase involved in cell wall biosynthesis